MNLSLYFQTHECHQSLLNMLFFQPFMKSENIRNHITTKFILSHFLFRSNINTTFPLEGIAAIRSCLAPACVSLTKCADMGKHWTAATTRHSIGKTSLFAVSNRTSGVYNSTAGETLEFSNCTAQNRESSFFQIELHRIENIRIFKLNSTG